MKILITGDEGFVGTNFKKHLDSKRNSITGIDIKSGVDVRDFFAKDDTKFDVVIHLAAIVGGRKSNQSFIFDDIPVGASRMKNNMY